jgi:hypothetical protein
MRKLFLLSLFLLCPFLTSSALLDDEMDIRAITPIKSGMNAEQQRGAVLSFLREFLNPDYELNPADIVNQQSRQCKARSFETYTFRDGSEWIMGQGGLNRFLGYLYLKKAIEHYGLRTLRVVDTRFAYRDQKNDKISISVMRACEKPLVNIPTIDSMNFFSLSRYVGDDRPTAGEASEELEILRTKIGFTDLEFNANLRKKDGIIYVIDTEYNSFSSENILPYIDQDGELNFTFYKSQEIFNSEADEAASAEKK